MGSECHWVSEDETATGSGRACITQNLLQITILYDRPRWTALGVEWYDARRRFTFNDSDDPFRQPSKTVQLLRVVTVPIVDACHAVIGDIQNLCKRSSENTRAGHQRARRATQIVPTDVLDAGPLGDSFDSVLQIVNRLLRIDRTREHQSTSLRAVERSSARTFTTGGVRGTRWLRLFLASHSGIVHTRVSKSTCDHCIFGLRRAVAPSAVEA